MVNLLYIGHSMGTEHDAITAECAPSSSDGGKYIMYPYSVNGYQPNNMVSIYTHKLYVNTVEPHLSGPHLSRLFFYPYTCSGTNPHSST